jgi:hypothetical protein
MPGTDYNLEAVKIAGEWNKQLSLWATGSIVVSISFLKDFLQGSEVSFEWRVELVASWVAMLASILFGHFAYGAPLTGSGDANWSPKITAATRKLSILQATLFGIGLALLIIFAAGNLPSQVPGSGR